MTKTNYLVLLLKEYLRCYDVLPDINQLRLILESDPSFPSLLSIRQTCNYFGIKTNAYKGDYDALLENRKPAIVHWKTENEEKFVLVNRVTSESVTYYDAAKHRKINISKDDFCKFWTGALIISEKNGGQKVSGSKTSIRKYWVYGLVVLAILITFLFGFRNFPNTVSLYFAIGLFILKATGVWLTANRQIRFDGIAKEVYDPINRIQLHVKQLCENEKDYGAKIKIIKDWYSRQSFQWFASRYPIDEIAQETIVGFAEQINENAKLNVNRVPVLWINNRMLPQEYSVTDIPLLCTDVNLLLQLTK